MQAILRNPKYTGFNVWNRHDKRRGRPTLRPRDLWVWSDEMTHEPLVPRELFDLVPARAAANENLQKSGRQRNAPAKRQRGGRFYVMRGRCVCDLCNHRMQGSTQKGSLYMRCLWSSSRGSSAVNVTGHPTSLQLKEDVLVEETLDFLATRVFAPGALMRLHGELQSNSEPAPGDPAEKVEAIRARLADLSRKIDRQVVVFEEYDDPSHPVVEAAKRRIADLGEKKKTLEAELQLLDSQLQAAAPSADSGRSSRRSRPASRSRVLHARGVGRPLRPLRRRSALESPRQDAEAVGNCVRGTCRDP